MKESVGQHKTDMREISEGKTILKEGLIMSESRYEECEVLKDGGREYLDVRLPVEIPPRPDDRFHKVVTGDRLDVLAHQYLGDASLWWVICDCNNLPSSLDLVPGMILRVPASDRFP